MVRKALITVTVAFIFASTMGVAFAGMTLNSVGAMSPCPLMGVPAFCHMSPLEHAFTLQSMLTVIPFSGIFALLVSILLAFAITLLAPIWKALGIFYKPILRPPSARDRWVARHTLQEAFSNGILNSKAF